MRIDKYTKQAIVRSIMQDVPPVDKDKRYIDLQAAIVKAMSPEVRKVFKSTPGALRTQYVGDLCSIGYGSRELVVGDVHKDTVEALAKPYRDEDKARHEAKCKLQSAIEACSTLKQLNDRLPEFKKYFPTEQPPTKNLPAIANVVADLSKLGWPKDAKKTQTN